MTAPEGERGSSPPSRLLPRALAALALLALGDLWANRHLEVGIDHPGLLASLGGAVTAAVGLMDRFGMGADARAWVARLWTSLATLLAPPVLAALWVVAAIGSLTVTSIVVIPAGATRVTPVGGGRVVQLRRTDGAPQRFLVTTTPFSRRYSVKVDGFLPATFDVPPLVGQTVEVGRDLRPAPSVLFRPPLPALASLENGRFSLFVKDGSRRVQIGGAERTRASFLLGRARPIPSDWMMLWRFELEREGAERSQVASTLLDWSRRAPLPSSVEISPGMILVAEVRSRADKLVACRVWTVGAEDLADVPLHVPEESQDASCRDD